MHRRVPGLLVSGFPRMVLVLLLLLIFSGTACQISTVPTNVSVGIGDETAEGDTDIDFTVTMNTQASRYNAAPVELFTDGADGKRIPELAARWVDGIRIELTVDEISEFEKGLYATKTKEEYIKYLEESNLAYYDKGIDLSVFEWYWDDMKMIFSDHRVDVIRKTKAEDRVAPDVIGMSAQEAFELLDGMGCLVAISYYYDPDFNMPVGYCYQQDPMPGVSFTTHSGIRLTVQAPVEITSESIRWDPDDKDFDIDAIAREIHESDSFGVAVPDVVGMYYEDAKRVLEDLGFKDVRVVFAQNSKETKPGFCFWQGQEVGRLLGLKIPIELYIQSLLPKHQDSIPNLVGLTTPEIDALLEGTDVYISYTVRDHAFPGYETATCYLREFVRGSGYTRDYVGVYMRYLPNVYGLTETEIRELLEVAGVKLVFTIFDQPDSYYTIPHCSNFWFQEGSDGEGFLEVFMSYFPYEMPIQ